MDTGFKQPNTVEMSGLYRRLAWNSPFIRGINSIASGIGFYTQPAMNRAFLWSSWYNRMAKRTGPWPDKVYVERVFAGNSDEDSNTPMDGSTSGEHRTRNRAKGTMIKTLNESTSVPSGVQRGTTLKLSVLMPFKPVNTGAGKQMEDLKTQLVQGKGSAHWAQAHSYQKDEMSNPAASKSAYRDGTKGFITEGGTAVSGLTLPVSLFPNTAVGDMVPDNTVDHKSPNKAFIEDIPEAPKVRIPVRTKPVKPDIHYASAGDNELADRGKPATPQPLDSVKAHKDNTNITHMNVNEGSYSALLSKVNKADALLMFRPSRQALYERINKQDHGVLTSQKPDVLYDLGILEADSGTHTEKENITSQKDNQAQSGVYTHNTSIKSNTKPEMSYRVKGKRQKTDGHLKTLMDAMLRNQEQVVVKPALNLATRSGGRPDDSETISQGYQAVPTLQFLAYGRQVLDNSFKGFEPSVFETINQPNRREIPASQYSSRTVNIKVLGQNTHETENHPLDNETQRYSPSGTDQKDDPDSGYQPFLPYTEAITDQVFEKLMEMTRQSGKEDTFIPDVPGASSNSKEETQQSYTTGKEEKNTTLNNAAGSVEPKMDVGLIVEEVYKRVNGMDQTEKERKGLY